MMIVALIAIVFAWAAAERRQRILALTAEQQRLSERLRWAENMQSRGYVSKTQVTAERAGLENVESQLTRLGAAPPRP